MNFRFIKIIIILIAFIFSSGFLPFIALLGPGVTVITSGNFYKAGVQLMVDKTVKNTTGKNSLVLVKEKIEKKNNKKYLNQELRDLVEKRIKLVRKKLSLENINQ